MGKDSYHGHPDHDACGTGFIVHMGKPASHKVVDRALLALQRLSHRGGVDADGRSGDGAGLLTEIPQRFMRSQAEALGIKLPGAFALGMLFLSPDRQAAARTSIEALALEMGLRVLGWRPVPVNDSVLGARALESMPAIWQCFLEADASSLTTKDTKEHQENARLGDGRRKGDGVAPHDIESSLFLFRKRAEGELAGMVYFCSLSSQTVVYKGLLSPWQLPVFYPDLRRRTFESRYAVFHQRFSTNTRPSWSLAQPFRLLAHNGELNTITGNRRWMAAREGEMRRGFQAGKWFRCLEDNVSDSASLDNALELLVRRGSTAEAGLLALVPPAVEQDPRVEPGVRAWLESAAQEFEPWDGPAALVFGDGRVVGAKLDRNGLRPLRYTCTTDGWLVAGSEVGIADFDDRQIAERQRLGPGEMLVVDLASGAMFRNGELLRRIAADPGTSTAIAVPSGNPMRLPSLVRDEGLSVPDPHRRAAAVGWSEDQLRLLLHPLAEGKEAIWSMGDDTPPAFMSAARQRRTLWDYCKQRFAQVTNPPIDPLREAHVMSLETRIGRDFISDHPVLDEQRLRFLKGQFAHCTIIDATFPASQAVPGAQRALEQVGKQAQFPEEPRAESSRRLVVLSDRAAGPERAALPILLATARVWQAMVASGAYRVPLIVETAQTIDTHHIALLLAAGATAVVPYLAMHLANEHQAGGAANYSSAVRGGLRKVLSRMGISTLASYRNGQLFETIGLDQRLCAEFFESAAHFAEATALEEILADYLHNHALAYSAGHAGLKDAGLYRYRKDGERHGTSPELMRKLHAHVKTGDAESYRQYEDLVAAREPLALRDRLKLVAGTPVAVNEVERETEILRRFSSQAMSLGAISAEAHRTLALAMNRLGARSNTGEGGEDTELYRKEPEAACKTKQVASGRFGVTAEYLVHAEEIEIKVAQGSKPGEGGQLPASKVTPYIAKLRHAVPGMQLISPPPHHDIYSIEDLEQLIHDLREVNPRARIGVKLVAGAGIGVIAAGVAKAGADVITISGHDGGTGASPLSSIKNTGLPWELGLREVHETLTLGGLRSQVRLRVDGGLKFGRDVVIAACLGADEYGFGTAALLAIGCVMARQCHLNTCPVGIATQDETLRTRFTGKPEMVIAYFQGLAAEVRSLLASLGVRSLAEINGRTEFLQPRDPQSGAWVEELLHPVIPVAGPPKAAQHPAWLAQQLSMALDDPAFLPRRRFPITNADRSMGARLSGDYLRRSVPHHSAPLEFYFQGTAGQSFGAFLAAGLAFHLTGAANDYVAKGLSGGTISISAGKPAAIRGDILAGNTVLYGATSGALYVAGAAGERFAVRNSGALAVVEGVGDHDCEYMTGGVVALLGPAGINLGSGMTGGLAYMLDDQVSEKAWNADFVRVEPCSPEEDAMLRQILRKHHQYTGSPLAAALLETGALLPMKRLQPRQLPCPVEQTWETVLQQPTLPAAEAPAVLPVPGNVPQNPLVLKAPAATRHAYIPGN